MKLSQRVDINKEKLGYIFFHKTHGHNFCSHAFFRELKNDRTREDPCVDERLKNIDQKMIELITNEVSTSQTTSFILTGG